MLFRSYVYSDYGSGRVWSLRYDGVNPTVNTELLDTQLNIASFGVDENNELYLAAFDGKIYRFKPTVPTSVKTRNPLPQSFLLRQNYPNPFNPRTTIEFLLETSSHVMLSVTDLLGRPVATLLDAPLIPGVHRVTFDGQRVATGLYLYRIESGTQTLVRKMLLLK